MRLLICLDCYTIFGCLINNEITYCCECMYRSLKLPCESIRKNEIDDVILYEHCKKCETRHSILDN